MSSDHPRPEAYRTLAFLFTDIEGSTQLWERMPDEMRDSLAAHDCILHEAIRGVGGQVVKTTGDGVMAAFGSAGDGLAACLAAQLALIAEPWGETGPLRVRMGLHVGEASGDGHDYHGQAVNRAARIMAAGHGGQVLLSAPAAALVMDRLPDRTSLRDLGEHHLKDMARPERLFQVVHPGLPTTFPPVSAPGARRRSLPSEPSAFVGREKEVAGVVARLGDPEVRLLTLTGPGGIGKTRLAIHAAGEAEADFAAGVLFVDLSAARDTGAVLTAIAHELGLTETSQEAQLERLASAIGDQELLALLDNFEQVTAAAPIIGQLLRDCPALKLLVTSREALHIRGEHILSVPPLALPASGGQAKAADIETVEAVRLFIGRAQAVKPDFRLTDDNAPILAEICRRLDGLPLAIELATARLRVFSLEALRDRLASQLQALGGGPRDLPERQRTLRATIDWSYQLLDPAEQGLLKLLSCFSGAELVAVEDVVLQLRDELPGVEPMDALGSLVDKSLLRQLEQTDGEPRFEMLESVREFASERLAADDEWAARARAAHASWYAGWAARQATTLDGPSRDVALASLGVELENLRAAWRWGREAGDIGRLEQLMAALWPLHDVRGWYRGLTDLARDAIATIEAAPPDPGRKTLTLTLRSDRARALTSLHGYTAEVEEAYEGLLESLDGVDVSQAYPVLRGLASIYMFRGESAKAGEMGAQIIALGRRLGDRAIEADGHMFLGASRSFGGPLADGLPELEAALDLFRERRATAMTLRLRNDPRVASLTALSLLYWWQGRLDTSLDRSERAVALALELRHPSTTAYALYHAALLRLWRGEPQAARDLSVRLLEVAEEHELHIWSAVGTVVLGASAIELGLGHEGMRWIDEGLEQYRGQHSPPVFWPFLLQLRAQACLRVGRLADGLRFSQEAIRLVPQQPDQHLVLGALLLATGSRGEAEAAFERAAEAARGWGARTSELRASAALFRLSPPGSDMAASRRAALEAVLASFEEGRHAPALVEARALLDDPTLQPA